MTGGTPRLLGCSLATAVPLLVACTLSAMAGQALPMAPLSHMVSALVPFRNTAFPYEGYDPETKMPFLDISQNGRRGHTSGRGDGIYWLDTTYSDNRALLALPEGFDLKRPAVLVVFFHGNNATLEDDVIGRQQVLAQLSASGLNGALIAPQMAVNALEFERRALLDAGNVCAIPARGRDASRRLLRGRAGGARNTRQTARRDRRL